MRRQQPIEPGVDDARLDHRLKIVAVELEQLVHRVERDDDPAPDGNRAAGLPAGRTARRDRHVMLVGERDGLLDVLGRARHDDDVRCR